MTKWSEEWCAEQPKELELVAQDIYIQRRNIVAVEHEATEEAPAYTDWHCESREIGVSEYEMLSSIEGISNQKAIDDYTVQLIEEGLL